MMIPFPLRPFLIVLFVTVFSAIWAEDEESILNIHHVTEFTLKNGMKVCLKQTNYEEEAVVFQLFAMGGYSALAASDRPSGILAADIAWESGLGEQSADQIFFDLYQNSIEIETKIQAFDRQIEAYCSTADLPTCLNIAHLLFTEPKFEKDALRRVLSKSREDILMKRHHIELGTHEAFLKAHTPNWPILDPLALPDLDYVNLAKAERFFKQCFNNPADFVFVLVGDFDLKTIKPLIVKYLESIPSKTTQGPINPPTPPFPKGVTQKDLGGFHRYKEILTRLTFPVPEKTTADTTKSLDCICHIMKSRVNKILLEQGYQSKKKLEVSYEFPFFPKLDEAWLILEFSTPTHHEIQALSSLILSSLNHLKMQGPTKEEIEDFQECLQEEDLEIEENTYILSLFSNYYRANWDIQDLYKKRNKNQLKKEVIKNDLNRYLKLDQYSIISIHH